MVDSTLQLPQEGTGPKTPAIETVIGLNTIKVPISLIAGFKTHIAAAIASPTTPTKNHLALMNASGSNQVVRVWDIKTNPVITGAVAANTITLNAARISDVGAGGSGVTIRKTDTTDADLPPQITARTAISGMTITSNELASCNVLIEETAGTEGRVTLYKADSVISPLVINPGQGLLVQQGSLSGVAPINVFMHFTTD